jgi:hypothetical protein
MPQKLRSISVMLGTKKIAASHRQDGTNVAIEINQPVTIQTNQILHISFQ